MEPKSVDTINIEQVGRVTNATSVFFSDDHSYGVDRDDPSIYHTRSGVTLKLKPVSQILVTRRANEVPMPEAPIIVDDRGREEPNLSSPSYARALREYDENVSKVVMGTLLLLGTEIIGDLPPDVPAMEDTSWSERLGNEVTWGEQAMKIPTDHDSRYIFWMGYIVLRDVEITEIPTQIRILGGMVPEGAVKEAQDSFRSLSGGDTDNRVATPNRAQRRNNSKSTRGRDGKSVRDT